MPPWENTNQKPPTDVTDAHRLGGYGIPAIPTQPTKLSFHRSFWRRRASHRFHGCTQIRRVWHPCHTHAVTKLSSHRSFWQRRASHRIHRIHRIFWRKIFLTSRFCEFCEFRGRICTVCLVGAAGTAAPPGRVAWVWQDAIPSYDCLVGALETSAPPGRLLQAFYLFY